MIPTSLRAFFTWLHFSSSFKERILKSSTLLVFHDLPGLLVLLSSPVNLFFERIVDLVTTKVLSLSLWSGLFCVLFTTFTCIKTSTTNNYQMPIQYLESTLGHFISWKIWLYFLNIYMKHFLLHTLNSKLKVYTSITHQMLHFKSSVMVVYRSKIQKVSKDFWTQLFGIWRNDKGSKHGHNK